MGRVVDAMVQRGPLLLAAALVLYPVGHLLYASLTPGVGWASAPTPRCSRAPSSSACSSFSFKGVKRVDVPEERIHRS